MRARGKKPGQSTGHPHTVPILGVAAVVVGVGGSLLAIASDHGPLKSWWGIAGLSVMAVALVMAALAWWLHVRGHQAEKPPAQASPGRVANRARDRARIYSERATVRDHDQAFDAQDDAAIYHRDSDIG